MLIDVTQDTPRPALDVAGATALLVVLAPLLVLLALLVVISDGRGPFFTQQRAGQGGPALHPLALVRQPGRRFPNRGDGTTAPARDLESDITTEGTPMLDTELLTDRIIAPAPARRARRRGRHSWYPRQGKPVFDALAAAALLALLAPVLAGTALVVLVALGRPVLFLQERVGKGGRNFTIYKFRTMTADRRAGFRAHAGEDRRRTHKSAHDPRLGVVGRFLRASSLDELPQLLNVLRGDMSLVGPRPEMVDIVDRHGLRDHPRHDVKPGITGLWQVSARGDGLLYQHVHVDLAYLDRITAGQDLRILLRTIPAALWGQRGM